MDTEFKGKRNESLSAEAEKHLKNARKQANAIVRFCNKYFLRGEISQGTTEELTVALALALGKAGKNFDCNPECLTGIFAYALSEAYGANVKVLHGTMGDDVNLKRPVGFVPSVPGQIIES